uniref:POU-specific domain-containing protein n=1 Tax=Fagus sylvatica TaxID=28930 RepID=A0A2N9ELV9_FAGSY
MGSSMCLFIPILLPFFLLMSDFLNTCSSFSTQPLCSESESLALLQFKQSFKINVSDSHNPFAYPKVSSWNSGKNNDCCSWDGVLCDRGTGHVIGLDLSSSYLYGSINSSSSLFHLVHLQELNLAHNNFKDSQIPPSIRYLSNLTHLNLSYSSFSGQVPPEILELSKLVPHILANLSSLMYLRLESCGLYGEFPTEVFKLPKLQSLYVGYNQKLTGYLPEFNSSSPLRFLSLANSSFSGFIPTSLGHLSNLIYLSLGSNNFGGQIPFSLANLTQLIWLDLSFNAFNPQTLSWLGKQTKLTYLNLQYINSNGDIPSSLKNLTQLTVLFLGGNQLTGQIPSWLVNFTHLTRLCLYDNNFSGLVNFGLFLKLENLSFLYLSNVHLSFPINSTFNTNIPKLHLLALVACNLTEFPIFLRYQHELEYLHLWKNKIHGQIPKWIFNVGKETLELLDLSHNFLTGFESFNHTPLVLPWASLLYLILDSNKLHGSLPVPPPSILFYSVKQNTLTGEISPLFCYLSSIDYLDLSHNNLSGMLPQCLSNLSTLLSLNLQKNNFHGTLPTTYREGCSLKFMDVSYNQLEGQVTRSLSNCKMLEILLLGNNRFIDIFPSWLGKLQMLRALSLRSNSFHGAIGKPKSNLEFPKLQIIDVSHNKFTGIETEYEKIQDFLIVVDLSNNRFEGEISEGIGNLKGLHLLNLSNNILTGRIPFSLGNLSELEALDLSKNQLSGEIPQQLLQLTFLEVFNVSNNNLTGPIPQGQQFSTFENNSYLGNTRLCGSPLTKKCNIPETSTQPPLISKQGEDSKFPSKSDWVVIMMGYGSGLIIGFIIGHNLSIRELEQFAKKFGRRRYK